MIEEKKLRLESSPFTVRDIIRESVQIVSNNAEKKSLKIESSLDTNVPEKLIGDSARLRKKYH